MTAATFGDERLPARFWAKARETESGCWEWTGHRKRDGYGQFGGRQLAHRVAFAALVGDLPPYVPGGLQLDHLCRNRACVNPAHLELVSHRENTLRGESVAARWAARDVCERGHRLTLPDGSRNVAAGGNCGDCNRERCAAHDAAVRAAFTALGITRRAYCARFGSSRTVAEDIAARIAAGVLPAVILAGADAAIAATEAELEGQLDLFKAS